jgi:hypothetical protein
MGMDEFTAWQAFYLLEAEQRERERQEQAARGRR